MLTKATVIHGVVCDLLYQNKFGFAHFPELVDLAVVGTGLGMLQSSIGFVKSVGSFWDSTEWGLSARPFLDSQSLAYANAISAWARGEKAPGWASDLPSEVKRPMHGSLKYLQKTNDSFFQTETASRSSLDLSREDWFAMTSGKSLSNQIIALRQIKLEEPISRPLEEMLVDKLRSGNREILLHAIASTEQVKVDSEPIITELRFLAEHHDDEVRAKAVCSLAKSGQLDEATIEIAAKMLDDGVKFVVFAGLSTVSTLATVPDHVLLAANRGFIRALQICDYDFVGLFTVAFNHWLDDPATYFRDLLEEDSPEYLEIALEALGNVDERVVSLG